MEQKPLDESNPNDFVIQGDQPTAVRLSMDSDFQTDTVTSKPTSDATLALDSLLTTTDFVDKPSDATFYGEVNLLEDEKIDLVDLTASNISLNSSSISDNIELPFSSDKNNDEKSGTVNQDKTPIKNETVNQQTETIFSDNSFGQTIKSDLTSTTLDKTEFSMNESKVSESFTSFKTLDNTIVENVSEKYEESVKNEQFVETTFEKFVDYDKPLGTIAEDKADEEEQATPAYETFSSKQSVMEEVSTSFNHYSPLTVEKSSAPEAQLAESVLILDSSETEHPSHSVEVTHQELESQSSKIPFKSPLDETLVCQLAQQPIEPVQVVEPLKQSFEQPLQFSEPSGFQEEFDIIPSESVPVQSVTEKNSLQDDYVPDDYISEYNQVSQKEIPDKFAEVTSQLYQEKNGFNSEHLDTVPSAPVPVESLTEKRSLQDDFVSDNYIIDQVSQEEMPGKVAQETCPISQVNEEKDDLISEPQLETVPSAPVPVESLAEKRSLEKDFVPDDYSFEYHQVSQEEIPAKVAQVTCPTTDVNEEEDDFTPSAPPALGQWADQADTVESSKPAAVVSNESISGYHQEVHREVESSCTVAAHPLTTSSPEAVVPPAVASETLSEKLEEDYFAQDKGVAQEEEQTSEKSGHTTLEESFVASSAIDTVTTELPILASSKPQLSSPAEPVTETMGRKNYHRDNSSDKSQEVTTGPDHLQEWIQTLLGSKAAEILYWRDPKNSGVVFGAGLVILFSLIFFSVISVVAYTLLFTLLGTLSFRIYKNVMQAVQKTDAPGHPFKEYLEVDLVLTQDRAHEIADQLVGNFNCIVTRMRSVLLVEDYVESLKYLFLFWVLTFIGAWFNGMTLVILAYISAFSLPKVYEMNKAQIDQYINLALSKINEVTEKVPFLKKTSTEKKED